MQERKCSDTEESIYNGEKIMIDNKDKKITFRVSNEDFDYLRIVASIAGMTVSAYMRTLAQATIMAAKTQEQKGALNVEDIKTVLDHKL